MRTHPSTTVTHGTMEAEVDLELAPLVLEIWRAGIETIHSCQDVGENVAGLVDRLPHLTDVARRETGRASIGFATCEAAVAFLEALANAGPRDELYERMTHWASPAAWQVVVAIDDRGLKEDDVSERAIDGTPLSRLAPASFQVHFPRADVGELIERLRRHNRGEVVALGRPSWSAIEAD